MSRSALWRQEAGLKERQEQALTVFQEAIEEGRRNARSGLRFTGPDDSFNLHPVLLQALKTAPYFVKCCSKLKDWNAVVDEIYYEVKHVEPWAAGPKSKLPSTAFVLLLRLFTLRCSEKQVSLMLEHVDSPYIRCIGFLYLRYACEPDWKWIEPYLGDEELFQPVANNSAEISIGEYVRQLFGPEMDYHGTRLPRLPSSVDWMQAKLAHANSVEERGRRHSSNPKRMEYFAQVGNKVRALYEDADNPLTWYEAVVDRVLVENGKRPKFIVTFPEYGNTETIALGEIDMPGRGTDHEAWDDRGDRRGGDRRGGNNNDHRHRGNNYRRGNDHNRGNNDRHRERSRSRDRDGGHQQQQQRHYQDDDRKRPPAAPPRREKTPQELAAIAEKKRRLMSKYG